MAYYDFLNVIFAPLLRLPALWAIIIISLLVSLLITLITKYFTDQELMKRLREEMKRLQAESKEAKNNAQKLMEMQKKQMELSMQQLKHSFKPTLITFLPIILIFGWMSSAFAYQPLMPNEEFKIMAVFDDNADGTADIAVPDGISINGNKKAKIGPGIDAGGNSVKKMAVWSLKGKEGEYEAEISYNGETQQKTILISGKGRYNEPSKKISNSQIKLIQLSYKKLVVLPIGYKDWLGWLGVYIWSSVIFTMILRKALKVY